MSLEYLILGIICSFSLIIVLTATLKDDIRILIKNFFYNINIYIILVFCAIIGVILILISGENEKHSLPINLGTEIVGIVLAYLAVQLYVNKQEEKNKKEKQINALTDLNNSIREHNKFLFELYRVSVEPNFNFNQDKLFKFIESDAKYGNRDFSIIELLNDNKYVANVCSINLKAEYSKGINWFTYLKFRFFDFNKRIDTIINRYIYYIDDPMQLKLFNNFAKNEFTNQVLYLINDDANLIDLKESIKTYVADFVGFYEEIYNYENAHKDMYSKNKMEKLNLHYRKNLWVEDTMPPVGSARKSINRLDLYIKTNRY